MKLLLVLALLPQLALALPTKDAQFTASVRALIKNSTMPDVYPGMVVASPSRENPNYYFDWVRDTALVMRTLVDYWEIKRDPKVKRMLLTWVDSEIHRQNRFAISGLGEPKYNIDGTGYQGPWGRPQNDGPALRAIAMIKFARLLIDAGEMDYVQRRLYFGVIPANSPIKKDLEYTAHHWREHNFEPWEEEMGMHFYNLLVQYTALKEGSKLAFELGDGGASAFYLEQSKLIGTYIQRHFFDERIGIKVSHIVSRPLGYKNSGIDVSPLLALNHTWPYNDLIPFGHPNVKKYVATLIRTFQDAYTINTTFRDLGVAIGRYPEDKYDGYHTGGQGNPWFLATLALGEHYCLASGGRLTALSEKQFQRALFHSDRRGRLDEQFNRETGTMQGAWELTWSHGAFMTAMMRCGQVRK
jgi:glucoamylase